MRVRKLTASGDYSFGSGQKDFWNNEPQGVGQVVKTRLKLFLGEWYLDVTLGMPWFETVLGKHAQSTADLAVQDNILGAQGVVNIPSFASVIEPNSRNYSVSATINTIYGTTEVEASNIGNF